MTHIMVTKRDGSKEPLNLEKLHQVVFWATEGITGVSASEVEIKSHIQFYNGIKTSAIQETLIKSAADLITEETPNYQYVAGRLINYHLRKEVYGNYEPWHLFKLVKFNIDLGFYDPNLLQAYSESEWNTLNGYINHQRDENFTYVAMEQWRSKYLVQNRVHKQIFETPQMAYMLIAATLFQSYPKETRLQWVHDYYNAISLHDISLPTPLMAGVRTPQKQFSSCVLIETDDSLDSINATASSIVKYVSQKAGIGVGAGRIRAINSPIRKGDAYHTGVIPFFKHFQSAVKSCSQGGVRGGAATTYYPIWHFEVENLLVLKNNKGTEENRVRHMDYGVQFNKLMYERLITGGDITLFSPHDVPEMYDAFFSNQEKFKELYERAERNTKIRKKTVKAVDLFTSFMQERKDTGRIYLQNVDHANTHSPFKEDIHPIRMSNLCCVTGDTKVTFCHESGDIEHMTMSSAVERFELGGLTNSKIKSVNNGVISWETVSAAIKTKTVTELYEIDDGNGNVLQCTGDHRVFTKNRGYVRADELVETDELYLDNSTVNNLIKIKKIKVEPTDVYDISVPTTQCFFADNILVHNCEINLPTVPLNDINDPNGRISLCTLSAINWGNVKQPADFERMCKLAVRGLDALLSYQHYPILAAKLSTEEFRPLGVGIINFAYFLAKHGVSYTDPKALPLVDEYAEAWSYYLIKASADLAAEQGPCKNWQNLKYADGILPIDTRKKDVDSLVPHQERMPWRSLREQILSTGIRNATLMSAMPSETSAQISNATNGIEPPRSYVSVKQSKDGVLKQVVPEYRRLKKNYELLWNQKSPEGYLNICAVLQKYIDQGISVNTSYNPQFFEDEKIPMSDMLKHLIHFYKYGGKQLYYFQTFDGQGEIDVDKLNTQLPLAQQIVDQDDCDACKI